jgi:hypothetical protein
MTITKIKNGFSYELHGCKYISIRGSPRERGYAHGYLVAEDFKKIQTMLKFMIYDTTGYTWEYFIEAGRRVIKDTIYTSFNELYEEMQGIADGINAAGGKTDLDEIIAWNNYYTLTGNWLPNKEKVGIQVSTDVLSEENLKHTTGQTDRCSAFIATGKDFTEDGKIVMAHNSFTYFIDGQYFYCVVDIQCDKGHRILYQCCPGFIWSGSDFFVTSKGIMGTETTIGGFVPYENKYPISCRIRKAMQYGDTLDDYERILWEGNSGDYANSWLFGDTNTNEIMRIELGLKYKNVERTKNGYFIGFNAPYDPRIRNLECVNSGYGDIRRHQGARRVRLNDLMMQHKGKLNLDLAKQIIADHYDVYLNKDNPCSRTVCSHYELDAREFMSQSDRPKPFDPKGAVDGCVADSTMCRNMSFSMRFGSSCGTSFIADEFFRKNRQWDYLRPYVQDRPSQDWTDFSITTNRSSSKKRKSEKNKKKSKLLIV